MNLFKHFLLALALAFTVSTANAASFSFVYTGSNTIDSDGNVLAAVGDLVTYDIVMDFSDEPTLGGGFDVFFTADTLRFEEWEVVVFGDPAFNRAPDVLIGQLESAAFGDFGGVTGPATVGRVSFTYLGGFIATLELAATAGLGGPFISSEDFVTPIAVDFGSATISTPLPGAVWFLLSAVGALGVFRRRRLSS